MPGYFDDIKKKYITGLRENLKNLPEPAVRFLNGIEDRAAFRTRYVYAYDLGVFFHYLVNENGNFNVCDVKDFSMDDLKKVTPDDIEGFLRFCTYYSREVNGVALERTNEERGKFRKMSAVRSMFKFLIKRRYIENNPTLLVDMPKLHEKAKVYMDTNEAASMLDTVESGEGLTKNQLYYHKATAARDLAIITLMLGTGIRRSELVGLDLGHINFEDNSFLVTRKGGSQAILYFSEEVASALRDYIEIRKGKQALEGHENALFLSMQNRRIDIKTVDNLVQKYAKVNTPLKHITPHKLRTTFGTNMYRETGDIYLVADILGHKDINTTRKHYADVADEGKRKALRDWKIRED